jgi:hypothetical protein
MRARTADTAIEPEIVKRRALDLEKHFGNAVQLLVVVFAGHDHIAATDALMVRCPPPIRVVIVGQVSVGGCLRARQELHPNEAGVIAARDRIAFGRVEASQAHPCVINRHAGKRGAPKVADLQDALQRLVCRAEGVVVNSLAGRRHLADCDDARLSLAIGNIEDRAGIGRAGIDFLFGLLAGLFLLLFLELLGNVREADADRDIDQRCN